MASSPGLTRSITIRERAAVGASSLPQPYRDSRSGSEERSSPCQLRINQLHGQECSRYLDCPSHLLERTMTTAVADNGTSAQGSAEGPSFTVDGMGSQTEASTSFNVNIGTAGLPRTADNLPSQEIVDAIPVESPLVTSTSATTGLATSSGTISPSRLSSMAEETDDATSRRDPNRRIRSQTESTAFTSLPYPMSSSTGPCVSPPSEQHRLPPITINYGDSASSRNKSPNEGIARPQNQVDDEHSGFPDIALPRWQPDAEVTYCPICHTQFSIFVRKHHCRKCGRVVCNSCSPHRIIIPHQYIVLPPGSENSLPSRLLFDSLGAGYFETSSPSGGERVRLCNPCVPDSNTAPPQSPVPPTSSSSQSLRHRTRAGHGNLYGGPRSGNEHGTTTFTVAHGGEAYQHHPSRWRSVTMGSSSSRSATGPVASHHGRMSTTYQSSLDRVLAMGPSSTPAAPSRRHRYSSFGEATSSRQRALPPPPPPPPPIAEEDECPICHQELPSRDLPDFEALRESHIDQCIQAHSTYGSPRTARGDSDSHPAPRRTGMYTYAATKKDCIDNAECTICLEEFATGAAMARLECLCRFHKTCISAWFVNHPGRCPVHQHDGFGF